jgi:hypothetical protein
MVASEMIELGYGYASVIIDLSIGPNCFTRQLSQKELHD